MTEQAAAADGEDRSGIVLIVEDDKATRQLLATVLAEERVRHQVAATGHEALAQAAANRPAMVVLDMHLPNLQGEAVATALRMQFGRSLPILIMSASNESPAAQRVGAYDFLPKPFDIADLMGKVRRGLDMANSATPAARVEQAAARQRTSFEQHLIQRGTPHPERKEAARPNSEPRRFS